MKWGGTGLLYSASRDRTIKVWAVDGSGRSQHKLGIKVFYYLQYISDVLTVFFVCLCGNLKVRTLTGHAHRVNTLALNCDYVLRTGAFQLGVPSQTDDG